MARGLNAISARSISRPSQNITVLIESVLNESHSQTANLTQYPVESGSFRTDHIEPNPLELQLTVSYTSNPISCLFVGEDIHGALLSGRDLDDTDPHLVLKNAWQCFLNMLNGDNLSVLDQGRGLRKYPPEGFTIVSELMVYRNMMPISVSTNRDSTTGGVIDVDMTWRHVRFVSSTTSRVDRDFNLGPRKTPQGSATNTTRDVGDARSAEPTVSGNTPAPTVDVDEAVAIANDQDPSRSNRRTGAELGENLSGIIGVF